MDVIATSASPRVATWMGTSYRITVNAYDSAGIVGMFESDVPAGGGPPIHIHHNEDEVIHVVSGLYQFWLDGALSIIQPGQSIFLQRGVPHTFRVIGSETGRNLTVLTPGGFEEFFIEAAAGDLRMPDRMKELGVLADRYGIEFRGPAAWPS